MLNSPRDGNFTLNLPIPAGTASLEALSLKTSQGLTGGRGQGRRKKTYGEDKDGAGDKITSFYSYFDVFDVSHYMIMCTINY